MMRSSPSTRRVSLAKARRWSLARAFATLRSKALVAALLTPLRHRRWTSSTSSREYQTWRFDMPANWAMAVR